MRGLLVFLVMAFVNTFGITQPTPAAADRAARVLGWVLLLALVVVVMGYELREVLFSR